MKKILLLLMILLLPITMFGCQKEIKLKDCMSEITKVYFEAKNENARANISVGLREKDYLIDGAHTENCEFSLFAIKFDNLLVENNIKVELYINGTSSQLELDLNPANHFYLADLGYCIEDNDQIVVLYKDYRFEFVNVSKDFGVDFNQAIKLGEDALSSKIDRYYTNNNFSGEGYLKVLSNEGQELFWVLTLVSKNGYENNVVLSVVDGEVFVVE